MEETMKYRFDHSIEDGRYVPAEQRYQILPENNEQTVSFGFLTEENRRLEKRLQISELNSGMDTVYWYHGTDITSIQQDERGCYVDWEKEGDIPLTFVTDVPEEGNYQVTVTVYAGEDISDAMIFLGRRRLAWKGSLKKGESFTGTFLTNICPIVPRTYSEAMEDKTLDVTLLGKGMHLMEVCVKQWEGPTLYIAGDSTVTDQSADYPYLPGSSYSGWGQMISAYMGMQMAVSNHAHSGLTTESFRSEGHYQILYSRIKKGDICLFQFGHNDQKLMHLKAEEGYRERLTEYIEEIQKKGALPVLVTPLARNSWKGNDGTYNDLLEPYARECIRLAKEKQILYVDLHEKSMAFVMECGRESAKRFFFPSDYTHSNDYGAFRFAGNVYEGLAAAKLVEPKEMIQWDVPEVLPVLTIPEEYANMENPVAEELFAELERPQEDLTRAEALEMVIQTMHFFPTNVYNDMFEDVIGHETYAGTVECAWQNGLIPDFMIQDNKFRPLEKITGKEFLTILLNGYQSRKTVTTEAETIVPENFVSEGYLKRSVAAEICRKLHI